ncbi:MAG: hypothetical protein IJ680_05615 [Paludibacteraceae bacterium]|nr:hypothetical protein [Paludibacteraceae bacterium]
MRQEDFSNITSLADLQQRRAELQDRLRTQQNRIRLDVEDIREPYDRAAGLVQYFMSGVNRFSAVSARTWQLAGWGWKALRWVAQRRRNSRRQA